MASRNPKFPCDRCGCLYEFRPGPVKVCRDCRQADPLYVALTAGGTP